MRRFFKLSINCDPSVEFFQPFIPKCPFNAINIVPIFYYFFTDVMLSVVELFFALKQKKYINENNIDSDNDVICTQSIKKTIVWCQLLIAIVLML